MNDHIFVISSHFILCSFIMTGCHLSVSFHALFVISTVQLQLKQYKHNSVFFTVICIAQYCVPQMTTVTTCTFFVFFGSTVDLFDLLHERQEKTIQNRWLEFNVLNACCCDVSWKYWNKQLKVFGICFIYVC